VEEGERRLGRVAADRGALEATRVMRQEAVERCGKKGLQGLSGPDRLPMVDQ
jgi:hypothetical protein